MVYLNLPLYHIAFVAVLVGYLLRHRIFLAAGRVGKIKSSRVPMTDPNLVDTNLGARLDHNYGTIHSWRRRHHTTQEHRYLKMSPMA